MMFAEHERLDEMQWNEAREPREVVRARSRDAERKRLEKLFPSGLWTGHRNLRDLVAEIEPQWPTPTSRTRLWEYFRHMHHDNNQMLHSTTTSLLGTAREKDGALWSDAGPS